MADAKYSRETNRFDFLGIDLNRPVDSVKPGRLPYGKNIRSFLAGRIEPREGLTLIAPVVAGQTPVHSGRRLNDPANATYARIFGAGTHAAYGQAAFTDLDSGYSGDPLALVPWRPLASPTTFMYIGDRSRMRKIGVTGALHTIGLPAPAAAPSVALTTVPKYSVIDEFDATTGWGQSGTAAAPTMVSRTPGGAAAATTTIAQILYDTGTTGWACMQLTSMVGTGRGERITFATSAETATIQDVFAGKAGTTTTIASIIYDSGTSGACSIALTTPIDQIEVDGLIRNSTLNENIRVVGKLFSPDGTFSIRAVTVGTFAATNTIQVLPSLRIYLVNNHAAGENISNDAMTSQVTVGTGTLTKTAALDLSMIVSGVPTQPEDYMGIGLLVDNPGLLTEIKVQLDVDSTVANQDFAHNYYTKSIRPSDLTPAVLNLQPLVAAKTTIIQRNIIDNSSAPPSSSLVEAFQPGSENVSSFNALPGPLGFPVGEGGLFSRTGGGKLLIDDLTTPSNSEIVQSQQLESGSSQWVDVRFRISDLIRVGTDDSRTLQNVVKIQILIISTGTINVSMDSWWIGGGYGPDDLDVTAIPYYYRYRARALSTNVASNWSPATRLSMNPYRQSVTVSLTQYAAPAGTSFTTTDFVLDVERFGGQLADWHYIGTTANAASPSFADVYGDNIVAGQPIIGMNDYQPWPVIGLPVLGTTGTVAGTTVNDSGASFSMSWAPGTRIIINNQPYTIYRMVSASRMEIVESAGSQSAVAWQINEPTILAQPLPCLWEWDGNFFACGDPVNPGRLYYANTNAETTNPSNYLDMTSPSEPLMNGLQYNTRSYVFSSENFIQILKTGNPQAPFRHENIPNGKGMFSRWGLTREPAPVICFLARDGVNLTTGGSPVALTDADLYDLFPNEGNPGENVNGVGAPDISAAQATGLRLAYYDEYLYFDYPVLNGGGGRATLVLAFDLGATSRGESPGGWMWDVYTPNVQFHYGEEGAGIHALLVGTTDANLYQYAGNSDNGTAISMELTTPSKDQGEPRLLKLYGDIMLDSNTAGLDAVCTPYFNDNATSAAPVTVNTASRSQIAIPLGSSWQTMLNISLNIVVPVSTAARPFFYIWEPRWTFESAPILAFSWEISPSSFGMDNFKSIGICKVTHVSTADLSLVFTVDGVAQPVITIPNSGNIYTQTIFRTPVYKGKLYKGAISSTAEFRLDGRDSFFEVKEWASDDAYQKLRIYSDFSVIEG